MFERVVRRGDVAELKETLVFAVGPANGMES